MRFLLLPFIAVKLAWHIFWFVAEVSWAQLGISVPSVLVICLSLWISVSLFFQARVNQVLHRYLFQQQIQQQKTAELTFWQDQLAKQPLHRDILLKTTVLSCDLSLLDQCHNYLKQATWLDPNHPQVRVLNQKYTE